MILGHQPPDQVIFLQVEALGANVIASASREQVWQSAWQQQHYHLELQVLTLRDSCSALLANCLSAMRSLTNVKAQTWASGMPCMP